MPSRAERRRHLREEKAGGPTWSGELFGREVIAALILGVAVLAVGGLALLLSGGDGGQEAATPAATGTGRPTFSPANADEAAIQELARKSIEALPRNQWPSLYDDFVPEFQARCSREEFVQAGQAAAEEQGENLPRLGYVRLEDVSVTGTRPAPPSWGRSGAPSSTGWWRPSSGWRGSGS